MEHKASNTAFSLPDGVVERAHVGRLLREVETLDNALKQAAIRGDETAATPKTSKMLAETLEINKMNILDVSHRASLFQFLSHTRTHAPILHMSFSADPSPDFLQQLMSHIRKEIHPGALLQVGLQPTIGAGCILRTTNKYFDFSLRKRLSDKREQLLYALQGVTAAQPAKPVSPKKEASA